MSNWIFVFNDDDRVFQVRIDEKTWPIFRKTPNRNRLRVGDNIIFYKSGTNGKKFIGKASIESNLQRVDQFDYSLKLSGIKVWKKPVKVSKVINNLEFISDKTFWGRYFQGGVRSINDSDFEVILSKT